MNPIEFETIIKLIAVFAFISLPAPFLVIELYKKGNKK